jgi:hypothetical protein
MVAGGGSARRLGWLQTALRSAARPAGGTKIGRLRREREGAVVGRISRWSSAWCRSSTICASEVIPHPHFPALLFSFFSWSRRRSGSMARGGAQHGGRREDA